MFGALLALLVLPGLALSRLTPWIDWPWLVAVPAVVSLVTFFLYRSDKRRAESGRWRIRESHLHLAELIGGWPGAFLGQRRFRHKNSKTSYQVTFWLIVGFHQLVALDSLMGFRFSRNLLGIFREAF